MQRNTYTTPANDDPKSGEFYNIVYCSIGIRVYKEHRRPTSPTLLRGGLRRAAAACQEGGFVSHLNNIYVPARLGFRVSDDRSLDLCRGFFPCSLHPLLLGIGTYYTTVLCSRVRLTIISTIICRGAAQFNGKKVS